MSIRFLESQEKVMVVWGNGDFSVIQIHSNGLDKVASFDGKYFICFPFSSASIFLLIRIHAGGLGRLLVYSYFLQVNGNFVGFGNPTYTPNHSGIQVI